MDFQVILTSRGMPCIIYDYYKYRKFRQTVTGDIIWRCTKKSCLGAVRTNVEQTSILHVKDEHNHPRLDPLKIQELLLSVDSVTEYKDIVHTAYPPNTKRLKIATVYSEGESCCQFGETCIPFASIRTFLSHEDETTDGY